MTAAQTRSDEVTSSLRTNFAPSSRAAAGMSTLLVVGASARKNGKEAAKFCVSSETCADEAFCFPQMFCGFSGRVVARLRG